jgi:hypothetical protein
VLMESPTTPGHLFLVVAWTNAQLTYGHALLLCRHLFLSGLLATSHILRASGRFHPQAGIDVLGLNKW